MKISMIRIDDTKKRVILFTENGEADDILGAFSLSKAKEWIGRLGFSPRLYILSPATKEAHKMADDLGLEI